MNTTTSPIECAFLPNCQYLEEFVNLILTIVIVLNIIYLVYIAVVAIQNAPFDCNLDCVCSPFYSCLTYIYNCVENCFQSVTSSFGP